MPFQYLNLSYEYKARELFISAKKSKKMLKILGIKFESVQKFQDEINQAALSLLGSGWVWVFRNTDRNIEIKALEKAANPVRVDKFPYWFVRSGNMPTIIDYQNERTKYLRVRIA